MSYNKPSGNANQISLGPGILYLGPTGATPTVDVGYVTGEATITFKREITEIRQGAPQTIIHALAHQEDVMIEFKGIEWDMDAIAKALADGTTSLSAPNENLAIGSAPDVNAVALQFVHKMADGGTLTLNVWKAFGSGEIKAALNLDKPHELPMKFTAMDPGATDWGGTSLVNGAKLVKLIRTSP